MVLGSFLALLEKPVPSPVSASCCRKRTDHPFAALQGSGALAPAPEAVIGCSGPLGSFRRRQGGAETCGLMPLTNCGAGRPHRPLQLFPFGGILRPTCRRSDGRGELLAVAESRGRRFVLRHVLRVSAGQVLVR